MNIKQMYENGVSISEIARRTGRDRKTIRKWIQSDGPPKKVRRRRPSKLDEYKEYIVSRMQEGVLNATVIYDEIKDKGYKGKITILRDFMQPYRPVLKAQATVRDERQIKELATLRFVHEAGNVVFLGPPGVGKTHLSVALAMEAIAQGATAYFVKTDELIADLKKAYEENRLKKKMKKYIRPKVLLIDEIGYHPLDKLSASLFFNIISERYENGSIILTSNKSFTEWADIFGESVIATAILDRLLHHASIVNIRGSSYRMKNKKKSGLCLSKGDDES